MPGVPCPGTTCSGIERLHHLAGGQDVRNGDEGTQDVDLVDHEGRRREQHALLGQPDGGVGFAVHALQVDQLEGSPAEIDGHPVVVLDVRRDELVALERGLELGRGGGEPLDAIRRIAVGGAHRFAAARGRDDDGGRREHVVAGGMIGVRLGVDDEAHRHRGEIA